MGFFFLFWMWGNLGKASRVEETRKQKQEEMVLEESWCFWQWWQCSQSCGATFTVSREETADEKFPGMLKMALMLRGQALSDILDTRHAVLWEWVWDSPVFRFSGPWRHHCDVMNVGQSKQPIHLLLVCGVSLPYCTVLYQASTVEYGISSHLWRLRPWKRRV